MKSAEKLTEKIILNVGNEMERGYIKLWRCIQHNSLWNDEKFSRGQAWLDLILLANHKPISIRKRGIKIDVDRGQVGWSERQLADRWQWSRGKVSRFLKELEDSEQIEQQNGPQNVNVTSLITITNYEKYQSNEPQNEPQMIPQTGHKRATNSTMNKNEKNEKNTSNEYFEKCFDWFWNLYASSNGHGRSGDKQKTRQRLKQSILTKKDGLLFCYSVQEYISQVETDRATGFDRRLKAPEVFAGNWKGFIPEDAEERLQRQEELKQ